MGMIAHDNGQKTGETVVHGKYYNCGLKECTCDKTLEDKLKKNIEYVLTSYPKHLNFADEIMYFVNEYTKELRA